MSNSRLEKFIYAICSMEVSDLPAPLSRIEILWNCLITGETPDFEPQSRNEQYLMAMLGLYELENLPTPMSRGEKLLYKIAMGETDLSDVPGYLSRYEELLKYLIENGGIGDFEYVLYTLNQSLSTLYQTVEKPVKSAILRGQTLVNLSKTNMVNLENGRMQNIELNMNLEVGKSYTLITNNSNNDGTGVTLYGITDSGQLALLAIKGNGVSKLLISASKITNNINKLRIQINATDYENGKRGLFENIMIIEGDYTNVDIPYFEGMQSVKMPVLKTVGKNLFDVTKHIELKVNNDGSYSTIKTSSSKYDVLYQLEPNTDYILSFDKFGDSMCWVGCRINGIFSNNNGGDLRKKITTDSSGLVTISFGANSANDIGHTITNIQLEKSSMYTSYEPYKTNILSASEDVELRGIGDAQDTLDCLTGELTQRIGEVVFDGSEDWVKDMLNDDETFSNIIFKTRINNIIDYDRKKDGMICDMFQQVPGGDLWHQDISGIGGTTDYIKIGIQKAKLKTVDKDGFKQWLSQNPVTVQYQFATESVKTVDLTTVDQDGQSTKLKSFNDVTHVEIKADNLIPSVNVEVATKIEETLSTLGLDHHDISETQNKLSQTIDEQSENTDATMMATTEIYEQIL